MRDYLRKHDWAREAYQTLKRSIAEEAEQVRAVYIKLKEDKARPFIEHILTLAKQERDSSK